MKRSLSILALAAMLCSAAPATARDYVYGPMRGILGEGYKQTLEKDGVWRVVTTYRARFPQIALNVALYRAAEIAREGGQTHLQILAGHAIWSWGVAQGFVYARPSDSPAPPIKQDCRRKACYTVAVAAILDAEPDGGKDRFLDPAGHEVPIGFFAYMRR